MHRFTHSDGSEVPFNEHDDYGFMRLVWDVSLLSDGEYEVEVMTRCSDSGMSTGDYDTSTTSILGGRIDHERPHVLGAFR